MRLLVVGAGVAGPAVALAARRVGLEVTVLERRDAPVVGEGSWLTLAPNGLDALQAMGALDAMRLAGHPSRSNRMYGATGRLLGTVPLGMPLADGTVALTLKRSALAMTLAGEAARAGADIRHGAAVVGTREHATGVTVDLADGETIDGELLVGADGVHSHTRRRIDPGAPGARYVGLTNFGGVTSGSRVAHTLEPEAWHFVFGRRSFFGAHPLPGGDVVWFVNVPAPQISRERRVATGEAAWLEYLAALCADDSGPASGLIRSGRLELAGDNTFDLPHVPTWWRGRSVLVGDAAHAPSPSSGQGASMALEDAVVLARCVSERGPDGLAAYEEERRDRVEAIVEAGARTSSAKIPGRVGRVLMEAGMQAVFGSGIATRAVMGQTAHRVAPLVPAGTAT